MSRPEKIFFTSPDPDYVFGKYARIAPNQDVFPTAAVEGLIVPSMDTQE